MTPPDIYAPQRFTVRIRRDWRRPVRPESEAIDTRTYTFRYGWLMDDDDSYPGEVAWIASDPAYPRDAPVWVASGDLVSPQEAAP